MDAAKNFYQRRIVHFLSICELYFELFAPELELQATHSSCTTLKVLRPFDFENRLWNILSCRHFFFVYVKLPGKMVCVLIKLKNLAKKQKSSQMHTLVEQVLQFLVKWYYLNDILTYSKAQWRYLHKCWWFKW